MGDIMMNRYFDSYNELSIENKRDVLLKDISDLLDTIETLCMRSNIKFEKLKSLYYMKNRELLFDEDYYELMFIYITYLKEDLALLLGESA